MFIVSIVFGVFNGINMFAFMGAEVNIVLSNYFYTRDVILLFLPVSYFGHQNSSRTDTIRNVPL